MCGIVGLFNRRTGQPGERSLIERMLGRIHHRGPDETGIYQNSGVSLGSARLSIIDLVTGQQPISNEDGSIWIVFNGEIYNYLELMAELKTKGHVFRTTSDTEVIVHLYEEYGVGCLERMNGQFAFALWNTRTEELFMARDRVGIRPLFYTETPQGALVFASEIKAILEHPDVHAQLDPIALAQIFTLWTTLTPRTAFANIHELPPGHYMLVDREGFHIERYWQLTFPPSDDLPEYELGDALAEFQALLQDAVQLRLRADVPVAAYLSGGLDSCTTCDFILRHTQSDLRTFSIGFTDAQFDETVYQQEAAAYLGTQHTSINCDASDIARAFSQTIWHTEIPVLRTAPIPMYLLSRLVRDNNIKVVVTGEGADEILAGYNIFKETLVRHFWARQPDSNLRPLLLTRLYPYLSQMGGARVGVLRTFFGYGLTETTDPLYSHNLRWHNTSRTWQFFSDDLRAQIGDYDVLEDVRERLPTGFEHLSPLAKAQYLETTIFMSSYLLSSQGDRVSAGNSVEGRYPFLDHRLLEFCAHLPTRFKVNGLTEKYLLKRTMHGRLPDRIVMRSKQPYRAPISQSLVGDETLQALVTPENVEAFGYFAPAAVNRLVSKAEAGKPLSETEGMALAGVGSTQVLHQLFVNDYDDHPLATTQPPIRYVTNNGK